jgi:uncharacterized protein YfdQ (DUF2303 family)
MSEYENQHQKGDVQAALEAFAANQARITEVEGVPVVVRHKDMEVDPYEDLLDHPKQADQYINTDSVDGFIEYWKQFHLPETAIFANIPNATFTGVIDYHHRQKDGKSIKPAWKKHVFAYTCPHTPEWILWTEKDEKWMTQQDFACFIEQNTVDIHQPPAAEMLEIANSMQASSSGKFKSHQNLGNGDVSFQYEETSEATAGKSGQLKIPTRS